MGAQTETLLKRATEILGSEPESGSPLVLRPTPGRRRYADKLLSYFLGQARIAARLRADGYEEDPNKAKVFSDGRDANNLDTLNIEEILLIDKLLDAEQRFEQLKSAGHVSEGSDFLETMFSFRANSGKQPKEFINCRIALYRVLTLAQRRGNIVCLPVDETTEYARMLRRFVNDFGQRVQPPEHSDKMLPKFTVRCMGFSVEDSQELP